MAEDDNKDGNEEASGGKSSKKLIIIVAIVVILSIGLSIGATLFFLKGDDSATSEEAEVPVEEVKKPAVYLDIKPPFVVTYDVAGRQRYMQVFISVQSRDQATLDAMELHMPLMRNKLIMLFSSKDFEGLQTAEGKAALRAESLALINEILEKEASGSSIEQVLFTNFVMQ